MIQWRSLIASNTGEIDYVRVRSLLSLLLAVAAGVTSIAVVFRDQAQVNPVLVAYLAPLLVPLTVGRVTDVLSGRTLSAKIQAGQLPGRRHADRGAA